MAVEQKAETFRVLLEDDFILHETGQRCHVTLDTSGLTYFVSDNKSAKQATHWIKASSITGCHCMRDKPEGCMIGGKFSPTASTIQNGSGDSTHETGSLSKKKFSNAYFYVYTYPLKKKLLGKGTRRSRVPILFKVVKHPDYEKNMVIAEKWKNSIVRLVRLVNLDQPVFSPPPRRRLLVLINPRSGPGKALQIFHQRVVPVLAEADVEYHLIITDHANHARDYIATEDLREWDGFVIVSGDGLIHELINGIMDRPDWKTVINTPIGIIPGGSGNGLARAIGHALEEPYMENTVLSSSLNLVSGRTQPMDIIRVETPTKVIYSFLSVGWGLLADVDIESEKLRSIGGARFSVWAVARVIGLRSYKGRVSYLPAESTEGSNGGKPPPNNVMHVPVTRSATFCHSLSSHTPPPEHGSNQRNMRSLPLSQSVPSCDDSPVSEAESALDLCTPTKSMDFAWTLENDGDAKDNREEATDNQRAAATTDNSSIPPLTEPVPDNWTVIDDDFVMVYVACQTHISSDCFFAPQAKLADGLMWMVVIKKGITRAQLVNFLLGMETGEHVNSPHASVFPVKAFRIEPFTDGGYLTVDGELVDYSPVQAEVMPSAAKVMVR